MGRIDDWIARRVKQARVERGLSQEALAEKLGISLQQIHKYEAGRNRISATRLAAVSEALGKPLDEFFEGLDAEATQTSQEPRSADRGRECLELVRNFEQVNDPEKRRALVDFLRALGSDKDA
jgi:transcriptional regulator with XRE-family HTH domain